MIEKKDTYEQKILEVLEKLQLPAGQLRSCEEYLYGTKGQEALEEIAFQDLSKANDNDIWFLFNELQRKKKKVLLDKLFHILFAIGGVTMHAKIPYGMGQEIIGKSEDEMAKKLAVRSQGIGTAGVEYYGHHFRDLMTFVQDNPDKIKEALVFQNHYKGRLILLAVYFLIKYKDRTRQCVEILKEDEELLEQYEELVISGLGALFQETFEGGSLQEIVEAVQNNQVNEHILELAKMNANNLNDKFKFCAFISYQNYPLSTKLKNVVNICLGMRTIETLNALTVMLEEYVMTINDRGENFELDFKIESELFIQWAASNKKKSVLEKQLKKEPTCYLDVMDKSNVGTSDFMSAILKEQDEALYQKHIEQKIQSGNQEDREKRINFLLQKQKPADKIRAYLRGELPITELYACEEEIETRHHNVHERKFIVEYCKQYRDEAFFRRCQVFMLLKMNGSFFREDITEKNEIKADKVKQLFEVFNAENVDILHQTKGLNTLYFSIELEWKDIFIEAITEVFAGYLREKKEETLEALSKVDNMFVHLIRLKVISQNANEYKKEILDYVKETNKIIKDEFIDILSKHKEWEDEIKNLLNSKKAAEREIAVNILIKWQNGNSSYHELFVQALEKERNAKVKAILESTLIMEGEKAFDSGALTKEELVKELHKGNKKHNLDWAYDTPFSEVHRLNGEMAEEEYMQAIFLSYDSMKEYGVSKNAEILAEDLNQKEFMVYVNELFDKWLEKGAEAKKRWVLYVSALHGGEAIVEKLKHQIQEWPVQARGAIAAEAVHALALNPLPQALLFVDGLSRKFKNKQVKNAAGKALEFAASQLGISKEELADRIVPDLGFDENVERCFDYGERSFKVTITPALEIAVFDESGKKLKNLPAPGKKDDEEKAISAYEEFKQLKKQMKVTISSQKLRLEYALSTEREWTTQAWKNLFVKNPIMHQFAIGLIWGIYEDRKLVQSFRYMEDGSFNTEDEEEYELPESGKIGLVHPIELSDESKAAWKQQLEDYEITQPIEQLDREIFYMTKEEADSQHLERFGGCMLNGLSLGGKLLGFGWYKGSVQDAGFFHTYYREDAEFSIGVELHFSGSSVEFGYGDNEITVYDARFYKAGTIARGSYMYEEADKDKAYFLRDIPARFFSEIVLQLTQATATSQERDEDWRKEAY